MHREDAEITSQLIRLQGPEARGPRLSAALLQEVLELLVEGCRGAVRLRIEGRSAARGAVPAWLAKAADFDFVGLEGGSTLLRIEAPPLEEVVPDRLLLPMAFQPFDPSITCLGVLEASLRDALGGSEEADLYDQPLLKTFNRFSELFAAGIESLEFLAPGQDVARLQVKPDALQRIETMIRQTAPPQRARVAGRIDTIRHSDRMFTLVLESGEVLRGVAEDLVPEDLARAFGLTAIVSGWAVFRPSGSVLRIEADRIEPATEDASVWSALPSPAFSALERSVLQKPQGPRSGLAAIIGKWPGDESEAELLAALEEVS